jgi:hypothetical protein
MINDFNAVKFSTAGTKPSRAHPAGDELIISVLDREWVSHLQIRAFV